jgi:tellurite methyltransferase
METIDPATARQLAGGLSRFEVLDVRSEEAFAAGHVPGSGHIAREELIERRAELPPRDTPLLVVAEDAARAADAAAAIEALGYPHVFFLDRTVDRAPWGLDSRDPPARLWRPARFLEEVLPGIREALASPSRSSAQRASVAEARAPRALDLACGAGRDAVYLALHGFEVDARDHDEGALERARALASRCGVPLVTGLFDLESPDLPPPVPIYDLVTCFRFLHRPLFPWIEGALAPGGWLVYETFRTGQERHGRPKRTHFLLARGELASAFPRLVSLRYEEPEPDSGPVTARLLARKPLVDEPT